MMCIICVDIEKNKLTSLEARRNMREIASILPDEHKIELLRRIWDKEEEERRESHLRPEEEEEYNRLLKWFKESNED